ncbi:MAG TPA: chorismate-binding protein, partial [Polyangiaceae bacterium]|nr:chorismate-binding protein [Polyangiaceae bacterium]
RTEALAGSEPRRGADLAEVQRLLLRDKDRREHDLVVAAIEAALEDLETKPVRGDTRVRTLGAVHHLVTPFSAPAVPSVGVLDVVARLHPTPALGGAPRGRALAFVGAREARGPYAGPVGWLGESGRGAFVVGIRSACIANGEATTYAGAGIVRGSVPALELAETRAKESAMLRALGVLDPDGGGARREARA